MKRTGLNSPLRVLAATSVALFSLLAVFTSTAAWFDSNRALDRDMNEMAIRDLNNFQAVSLYETVHADGDNYYFSSTPIVTAETTIPLGGSDDPFRADDPYHPLLMVIEYEGRVTEASVFASTNSSFICDTATEVSRNPLVSSRDNPLSSIIKFYTTGFASAIPTSTYQGDSVYAFSTSTLQNSWTSSAFASLSGNSVAFNGRPCLYYSGESEVTRVAIIMEYNIDAINFISGYYMGNEILNEDIDFTCDWALEV